jgi:hypothetical protein
MLGVKNTAIFTTFYHFTPFFTTFVENSVSVNNFDADFLVRIGLLNGPESLVWQGIQRIWGRP